MNKLEDYGFIQSRPRGEYHANNQQMSKLLHKAVGLGNKGAAPQACTSTFAACLFIACLSLSTACSCSGQLRSLLCLAHSA